MVRWFKRQRRFVSFGTGLTAGLLIGVGMLVGALVATNHRTSATQVPEELLHAVATHGSDSLAMATGPISDGVEGVFFLDFLTGDIRCQVINPRFGGLGGVFYHNVAADLGVEKAKKQSFLLCTGVANLKTTGGSNFKFADSVVYVADANTGNWAAYLLPWSDNMTSNNQTIVGRFRLIGTGKAREIVKRD